MAEQKNTQLNKTIMITLKKKENRESKKIKLDPYLVKRKPCPFRETYKETWDEFTGQHGDPRDVVRNVGSFACSECKYFDPSNFNHKERPTYIICNHE